MDKMGLFDFFKGKKADTEHEEIMHDLVLNQLRTGCFVDYDLTSWKVTASHKYAWGEDISLEWQLVSAEKTLYLEMEEDDVAEWSMSESIPFADLGDNVRSALVEAGDPPDEIVYNGVTYYIETALGGYFFKNGQEKPNARPEEMLAWDFCSEDGDHYLSIEQWGETEFTASKGWPVEEYQFTNILPAG